MSASAIQIVSLRKSYSGAFGQKPREVLRGINLEVPAGSAFGLIGPNGAGKTTLIKAMLAVLHPNGGSVSLFGSDPNRVEVRARIGYLPERVHLPPAWNPREILLSLARLKRVCTRSAQVDALLERVGLSDNILRCVRGFSKGMRQRVGLAAALLGSPDLLILDEPTDGIDPLGRVEMRNILLEERKRGATLFINSHLLSETERICNQIGVLVEGRLARQGALDDLCRSQSRWLLRFQAGVDAKVLESLGFTSAETGSLWRYDSADAISLNRAVDRARQQGAVLIELMQDFKDLEEVLAEAVEHNE